jgi:hypothetical protein
MDQLTIGVEVRDPQDDSVRPRIATLGLAQTAQLFPRVRFWPQAAGQRRPQRLR